MFSVLLLSSTVFLRVMTGREFEAGRE